MRLAGLAGIASSLEARSTWRALDPTAPEDYRQLAALLLDRWYEQGVQYVGIGGGQGTGKSTLGRLLMQAGELSGLNTCVLSIDDFYLPRADRLALARQVHPLLATRGPPGTHDIALCRSVLDSLPHSREVAVPVFDKGRDDRHRIAHGGRLRRRRRARGLVRGRAAVAAEAPRQARQQPGTRTRPRRRRGAATSTTRWAQPTRSCSGGSSPSSTCRPPTWRQCAAGACSRRRKGPRSCA